MRIHYIPLLVIAVMFLGCKSDQEAARNARAGSKEVTFATDDGQKVFADFYEAVGKEKGLILMFHQAGSSSVEYAPIVPKVTQLGFACLAVDQRSGGDMFGGYNRTAAAYRGKQSYDDAYQDMNAALQYALTKKYKNVIAWGSSYSASLVFRLADEHPEVKAVLAFSPGEYLSVKGEVKEWVSKCKAPTLMAFTQDELRGDGQNLFKALPQSARNVLAAFPNGVHGSATLRPDRNEKGMSDYWLAVDKFLQAQAKE